MVKLFGWEKKMSASLKEKREEELEWIWKDKVLRHDPFYYGTSLTFKKKFKIINLLNDSIK